MAVYSHTVCPALERWLSGLKRTPGKREYPTKVPGVRIPPSPPIFNQLHSGTISFRVSKESMGVNPQISQMNADKEGENVKNLRPSALSADNTSSVDQQF